MARNQSWQARRAEERARQQSVQGISWVIVASILGSITFVVGAIVNWLDFINKLRDGYQQFLWLGIVILVLVWLIILWLLFKQRNVYAILWLAVTVLAGVVIWNGWQSYIQTREAKLVVLIAEFDGPEEIYGLRNDILEELDQDFSKDIDVEIESVNETITPDSNSGRSRALELGETFQADIVIWGWYRPTENPNMHIHLENLAPEQLYILNESTTLQPVATLAELETSSFQHETGQEASSLISFLIGIVDYQAHDTNSAIVRFDQAINKLKSEEPFLENPLDIYFYRANANFANRQYNLAIQDYDKVINSDTQYVKAYKNRGQAYRELKEYDLAIQDYETALNINPNYADVLNCLGIVYDDLKQFSRAMEYYDIAIELDPNLAFAYTNRGVTYSHIGNSDLAIQEHTKAIELDANFGAAYNNRGIVYDDLGEYKLAIGDYNKAIDVDQVYYVAEYYSNRGVVYGHLGKYELAIQDFDKAIEINPNLAISYINRGVAFSKLGQYNLAIQNYNKAINLDPNNGDAYYNLGNTQYVLGQYLLAIQAYDKAIELNPNDSDAYKNRGNTYQKLGKTAEAEADFKKYEELIGEKP